MEEILKIKQRFGIIGNASALHRAINIAVQVAPTDLSVLITGESGVGKEVFPQIIHQFSARKHGTYIAVNCGAIPEGTIDSELFGHEKGSFTGATDSRKGYFEVADGGTIFLDEVAELPLSTQVRLLRVLETGEFLKVGSSKVLKTNVRVIAATNIDIPLAIEHNRFREDLFYRLNTVPINIPPLRERPEDIHLLFRKFAADFAEKYRMPAIQLDDDARELLTKFSWPGNVRQLKNITEQISVIEHTRNIDAAGLRKYLPVTDTPRLPVLYHGTRDHQFSSEREIMYQLLFDMRKDVNELKKLMAEVLQKGPSQVSFSEENSQLIRKLHDAVDLFAPAQPHHEPSSFEQGTGLNKSGLGIEDTEEIREESLSLLKKEKELIRMALEKHGGKRKYAAEDLGISERTLYRKIKDLNMD
jgi:transcriptional regulator with PAS, ATPase and Fis domain